MKSNPNFRSLDGEPELSHASGTPATTYSSCRYSIAHGKSPATM
mgnify:CR=1 FL=1